MYNQYIQFPFIRVKDDQSSFDEAWVFLIKDTNFFYGI